MANLNELNKLEQYLKDNDYSYRREDYEGVSDWHQIIVYDRFTNRPVWDAICHRGSYGYNRGLIEVSGNIAAGNPNSIAGFLTADDVVAMINRPK